MGEGAEDRAEVFAEWEEEDVFDREGVAMFGVKLASALGLAGVDPVGSAIRSAVETGFIDEGFEEDWLISIASLPVERQSFGDASKDARGKVS